MSTPIEPPDPYERYRADRIEADKRTKGGDDSSGPSGGSKSPFYALRAYILFILHKFLDLFTNASEKGISSSAEKEIRNHLFQLKNDFETLKREDRSQDSLFLNQLSEHWHRALEDILRFRKETPLALQFKNLLKEIDSYPEKQEFTFGYYLTEFAGQKWLPFPYMELVQKMHDQHQKSSKDSTLSRWVTLIDDLIQKMEPRL